MVVLIRVTNTLHNTNVEYLVTFGITNTEFQNSNQSIMMKHLVTGNTNSLKREYFACLLKQSMEKACPTELNGSG